MRRLVFLALASAVFARADTLDIPAGFDSTLDFWGGVVNSNQLENNQMWAGNSGIAPSAGEPRLNSRLFERFGAFMRFDLSGVTPEMVNDPNFRAVLDVMFHGFAADRNVFDGSGATTPPEFAHHAGDGRTDLLVHAITTDHAPNANRWLANSASGNLLNWDGTVPTNITEAVAEPGSFGPANYEAAPRASATLFHGWSADPPVPGATLPNQYGELTWDVTSLVRDWVNGVLPNYGIMICTDPATSYGEQVNLLTMESTGRPPTVVNPGDATPMLRLSTAPAVPVPPATPTGLVAIPTAADGIDLSWDGVSGPVEGYRLERRLFGAMAWDLVLETTGTSHADTGLAEGTTYEYRVRAFNEGGASDWSAVVTGTTDPETVEPPVHTLPNEWARDPQLGWLFGYDGINWAYSELIGFIEYSAFPWIYHFPNGWLYFAGRSADDAVMILFFNALGWVFTFEGHPGLLYLVEEGEFIDLFD